MRDSLIGLWSPDRSGLDSWAGTSSPRLQTKVTGARERWTVRVDIEDGPKGREAHRSMRSSARPLVVRLLIGRGEVEIRFASVRRLPSWAGLQTLPSHEVSSSKHADPDFVSRHATPRAPSSPSRRASIASRRAHGFSPHGMCLSPSLARSGWGVSATSELAVVRVCDFGIERRWQVPDLSKGAEASKITPGEQGWQPRPAEAGLSHPGTLSHMQCGRSVGGSLSKPSKSIALAHKTTLITGDIFMNTASRFS